MDISKVAARAGLTETIVYKTIQKGLSVGARATKTGVVWHARRFDADEQKLRYTRLAGVEHLTPGEQFDAACVAARKWDALASGLGPGASTVTIADIVREYGKAKNLDKYQLKSLATVILSDPVADIQLAKLCERHLTLWVERRRELVRRGDVKANAGTIGREAALLKAALNLAKKNKRVSSDEAWAEVLRLDPKQPARRELYLDRAQRLALIAALPTAQAKTFFTVLNQIPLRPGALARADVGDFNQRTDELLIRHDKCNANRRIRIHPVTAQILRDAIGDRAAQGLEPDGSSPLLINERGHRWVATTWGAQLRLAVACTQSPQETVAYTFRHSTITDLVIGGVDPLTTARIAGTSVEMISATYGHLVSSHTALAVLAA